MSLPIPTYPYPNDTAVDLEAGKLIHTATLNILKKEGLEKVKVLIEPGEYYYWEDDIDLLNKIKRWMGRTYHVDNIVLGTHQHERDWRTGKTILQQILIASKQEPTEVLDTIIHEVAHAKGPYHNHGKAWQAEYYRLRALYTPNSTVDSGNSQGRMTKV